MGSQNLRKVKVNSDCPDTSNHVHQWTTHEGKHPMTGLRMVNTWCKACGAIPK